MTIHTSVIQPLTEALEAEQNPFALSGETGSLEILVDGQPVEADDAQEADSQATSKGTEDQDILCQDLSDNYVRREGRFFRINNPTNSISASDLKRVSVIRFQKQYPQITLTDELWRGVYKHAVEAVHSDSDQTIRVWDGRIECSPQHADGLIPRDGDVSINSWFRPRYRELGVVEADGTMLDQFLERVFPQLVDRETFKDWLSWSLQHEDDKPAWTFLLYSPTKGTGKSTLAHLVGLLFGEENSISLNGISKLTGRFNQTVMTRKLVVCEEVKLKPGTDTGNAVKAYITEPTAAVEGKGKEVSKIRNVSVFVMTSNHYPHWIESDDRRFYVADANHAGHASGPDQEDFQSFMALFHDFMSDPVNIAKLYNSLMARKQSNHFNPKSLNAAAIDTPLMKRIHGASGEVLLQELEEIIAGDGTFAIPQSNLRRLFTEKLKTNPNRIPHFMNELGWVPEKAKWGGVDYVRALWVHPDYQVSNGRVLGPDGYDRPVVPLEEEIEII